MTKHRRAKSLESRELHLQLGSARQALSESHGRARVLQTRVRQQQTEKKALMARLERVDGMLAARTPVPSLATQGQDQLPRNGATRRYYFLPIMQATMLRFLFKKSTPVQQELPKRHSPRQNPQSGPYSRLDSRPFSRALPVARCCLAG